MAAADDVIRTNPWSKLARQPPQSEYVLPEDALFMTTARIKSAQLRLELPPVPFIGDPRKAPVILLQLNPGWSEVNARLEVADAEYIRQNRLTLGFQSTPSFFPLADSLKDTPGGRYWHTRLKRVIEQCGLSVASEQLACVEWFPYHSARFGFIGLLLPSQEYGFRLVENAVRREALFVLMRREEYWMLSVPALRDADRAGRIIRLVSQRGGYLSEKNICDAGGLVRICDALTLGRA